MKLHLPKVLFTAVVAALGVQYAGAEIYTVTGLKGTDTEMAYATYTKTTYTEGEGYVLATGEGSVISDAWGNGSGLTASMVNGNNTIRFASGEGISISNKALTYTFSNWSIGGLIVDSGATGYSISAGTVNGNRPFKMTDGVYSIGESFLIDTSAGANGDNERITLSGTQTWTIAKDKTMTLTSGDTAVRVDAGADVTIGGEGTFQATSGLEVLGNLTVDGTLSVGAALTLANADAITGTNGTIIFGEGATLVYTGSFASDSTLTHDVYGYKTNKNYTVDFLGGTTVADREVEVQYGGQVYTMSTDGTVAELNGTDNRYYISGDVNASTLNASDDDVSAADSIWMTGGTLTMDKDYTVSGSALITGTTISKGEGKLIVANGATVQVDVVENGQKLKGNVQINAGGTLEFLGTGSDAMDYNDTGRSTVSIAGTMDVGTTRQTVGGWTFNLLGGTIEGAGQPTVQNIGLDFHAASTVNAKAADGAAAANPTVSTISTKVRYNGALNVNVEENARLDVTGAIMAGNKLTKSGAGTLRLANNDNSYADKAFDVTGGTLELRDNGVTMNGLVTIGDGAKLKLQRSTTDAATLANVSLNGGSLISQGTKTGGSSSVTVTALTVGEKGGTVGFEHDSVFGDSWNGSINIQSLSADSETAGDLNLVAMHNVDQLSTIAVNGGPAEGKSAFKGNVNVKITNTENKKRQLALQIGHETALENAVLVFGGGEVAQNEFSTDLVLATDTVKIAGIKDGADRTSTGTISSSDADTARTLHINTGSNSYSTSQKLDGAVNIVKEGTGTQNFSGDMSAFNGTVEVSGGTLGFTKADGDVTVSNLTLSGGTLEVTGSLTLSNVAVSNLASYFDAETLSATLVTAGSLSFDNVSTWTGSTYEIDGKSYTTSLSVVDNSLKLNFTADSLDTLDVYVTMDGTRYADGTLTLAMVDIDGNPINTAADNYNVIGLYGGAKWDDIRELITDDRSTVGITLQGDGFTIIGTGDTDDDPTNAGTGNVSFYGKYYGEANVGGSGAGEYRTDYIPEPATATLSLLALMGLAARRRRR